MSEPVVRSSPFASLDAHTLYEILRLRIDVFVVEQACAFGDLDGRDRETTATHLWIEGSGGRVLAYARLLPEDDGATTIGRIVTRPEDRGTGLGALVLREAMARIDGPMLLKAQAHLAGWYEHFGFDVIGDPFDEDGIAHVPMRHPGNGPSDTARAG